MRKDLKAAFELAAEHNSIDYYKDMLKAYQEDLLAQEKASKAAASTPAKSKSKSKAAELMDVEMADEPAEEVVSSKSKSKSKKRKAEEEVSVSISQALVWVCDIGREFYISLCFLTNPPIKDACTVQLGQESQEQVEYIVFH